MKRKYKIRNLKGELWQDIKGYEGLYKVSNMGRVKSLKYGKEKLLKPFIDGGGYCQVKLYKNGKMKTYKLHRLVANAFIPNFSRLPQVNHINEIKTDNRASNLEWCNNRYNKRYSSARQVMGIGENGHKTILLEAVIDGEDLGFSNGNISMCCNGKFNKKGSHKYKGIEWYYIPKGLYKWLVSMPKIENDFQNLITSNNNKIEYR